MMSIKSCLLDLWSIFLIKGCSDILPSPLKKLVNCSLIEGHVIDGIKTAVDTCLIEKASLLVKYLKNSYPISSLRSIFKLVERVVAKLLLEHIHIHD